MYCTKCGKELFDEAVMCPQCGTPTINAETPVENAVSNEDFIPSRNPDVKMSYYVGEIGEKFPLELYLELGDFYFYTFLLCFEHLFQSYRMGIYFLRKFNFPDVILNVYLFIH